MVGNHLSQTEITKYLKGHCVLEMRACTGSGAGVLEIDIKVLDYKCTYGRHRFLVTPAKGKGQVWAENVKIVEKEDA